MAKSFEQEVHLKANSITEQAKNIAKESFKSLYPRFTAIIGTKKSNFEIAAEALSEALDAYKSTISNEWDTYFSQLDDEKQTVALNFEPSQKMSLGVRSLIEFTDLGEYFCRGFLKYVVTYPKISYTYLEKGRSKFKPKAFYASDAESKLDLFFGKQRQFELPIEYEKALAEKMDTYFCEYEESNETKAQYCYVIGSIVEKMYIKEVKSTEKPLHDISVDEYMDAYSLTIDQARMIANILRHASIVIPAWEAVDRYYLTVTDFDTKKAEELNNAAASNNKREELKNVANGEKEAISIPEITEARNVYENLRKIHEEYTASLSQTLKLLNSLQAREDKLKSDTKLFAASMTRMHDVTEENKKLKEDNKKYKVFKKVYDEAVDDSIAELNEKAKERISKFIKAVRLNPQKVEIDNFVQAFMDDLIGYNSAAKEALKRKTKTAINELSSAELKEALDDK